MAYNSLLHLFAVGGRAEDANKLYQAMQAAGPAPDVITMNTLIATYAQVRMAQSSADAVGVCTCMVDVRVLLVISSPGDVYQQCLFEALCLHVVCT